MAITENQLTLYLAINAVLTLFNFIMIWKFVRIREKEENSK